MSKQPTDRISASRWQLASKVCGCLLIAGLVGCGRSDPPARTAGPPATDQQQTSVEENAVAPTSDTDAASGREGQVLRHAVFFAFKESSSEEDVQGVVDAFAGLPEKIDSIIDFQWVVNNSPDGFDDGFTHCFLLTFQNEADRDAYIPHPAHSGEFAAVLSPHMKDVFVIDYWATPPETEIEKELKHAVFFKFKDDASAEAIENVEEAFAELPSKIDAIKAFEWGINNSPETNDDGFTHCFMVTFDSEEGRDEYLPHPDHQAFVEVLKPVLDKVRVLDWWEQ